MIHTALKGSWRWQGDLKHFTVGTFGCGSLGGAKTWRESVFAVSVTTMAENIRLSMDCTEEPERPLHHR